MGIPLRSLGAVLLTLAVAGPAHATVVRIEAAGLLADEAQPSVPAAIRRAIAASIREAGSVGLSAPWLDQALVLSDRLVAQALAVGLAPAWAIRSRGSWVP